PPATHYVPFIVPFLQSQIEKPPPPPELSFRERYVRLLKLRHALCFLVVLVLVGIILEGLMGRKRRFLAHQEKEKRMEAYDVSGFDIGKLPNDSSTKIKI